MSSEQPYEEYRLAPGRTLMVPLPAATELRCLQGHARIVPAPEMLGDALRAHAQELAQGQAYRAPHDQWVTLESISVGHASRLACMRPAAQPTKKNRLVAQAARRLSDVLAWLRRAPRAASSRTL
jgi:hypothetical protein